jgi:hypothetical protein
MGQVEQPTKILERMEFIAPRDDSLRFDDAIKKLTAGQQFNGDEEELTKLAQTAKDCIANLADPSRMDPPVEVNYYQPLAIGDILDALGRVDHSAPQWVIAESLTFPIEHVQRHVKKILSRKDAHIYEETFVCLFTQENPEATELALSILEENGTAGYENGTVYPEVKTMLLSFMSEDADEKMQRRAAIIASRLYKRMEEHLAKDPKDSDLFGKAQMVLEEYIRGITKHYDGNQDAFTHVVADTVKANNKRAHEFVVDSIHPASHQKAQVSYQTAIGDMSITLSGIPGEKETEALIDLLGEEVAVNSDCLTNYYDLQSLIRYASRQQLLTEMTEKFNKQLDIQKKEQNETQALQLEKAKKVKELQDRDKEAEERKTNRLREAAVKDKTRGQEAQSKLGLQIPQ